MPSSQMGVLFEDRAVVRAGVVEAEFVEAGVVKAEVITMGVVEAALLGTGVLFDEDCQSGCRRSSHAGRFCSTGVGNVGSAQRCAKL